MLNKLLNKYDIKAKCCIAFILGTALVFALPPFFAFPVSILSLTGFYLLLQYAKSPKQAFWLGWSFGFGYFMLGTYWVANSLLVDGDKFAWLIPFAVSLIPALSAIFIGIVTYISHRTLKYFKNKLEHKTYKYNLPQVYNIIVFACMWAVFEAINGYLTQFPWNFVGYIWISSDKSYVAQFASVIGVSGLSFLIILFATSPALMFQRTHIGFKLVHNWQPVSIVWSAIFWLAISGIIRVDYADDINQPSPDSAPNLRIIQANIPQKEKHDPTKQMDIFLQHIGISTTPTNNTPTPDIIIWSEAATNYMLADDKNAQKMIVQSLPENSSLITGTMRTEGGKAGNYNPKVWNSLAIIGNNQPIMTYDKNILVPFGEFVPFQKFIPFIDKITHGSEGFSRGDGAKILKIGNTTFSPLICYEAIFSDFISADSLAEKPDFLLNITNDSWFGDSIGPYQHLHMTKMRTIETQIPLIRVAGTGISAIIDRHGTILSSIPLNEQGIIDTKLPKLADKNSTTLFYQYGNLIPFSIISLILLIVAFCAKYTYFTKNKTPTNQ